MSHLDNAFRDDAGPLAESECFIDATSGSAKGRGDELRPTKRGKGANSMVIVERRGLKVAVSTHAGERHEATLVQLSFEFCMIEA